MASPPSRISMPDNRNYANAVNPYSSDMSGFIGPAIAAGSSVLSSLFSANSAQAVLDAQREENRINRKYNSEEAQKSRDFQRQMFNAENEYNDPKRVVSRLMAAGVNPALAFGNFANSASIGGSSSASSSGSLSPVMPDWSGIGSAGRAFLDGELIKAQTRNINAQAAKTESETPWVDQLNSIEVQLKQSGIDLNLSSTNVNEEQAKVLTESLNKLKVEVDNLSKIGRLTEQQIRTATSDANIRAIDEEFSRSEHEAELGQALAMIDRIESASKLDKVQKIRIMALLSYEQNLLSSSTRFNNNNADVAFENWSALNRSNLINDTMLKNFGLYDVSKQVYENIQSEINLRNVTGQEMIRKNGIELIGKEIDGLQAIWNIGFSILSKKGK